MSSWWSVPFMSVKPFSFLISFSFKSILSDTKMDTLAWFLGSFAWNIFFHSFTPRWYLSLMLGVFVRKTGRWILFFFIHSVSLCLFRGVGNWYHWCWELLMRVFVGFHYLFCISFPSFYDLLFWNYSCFLGFGSSSLGWSFISSSFCRDDL